MALFSLKGIPAAVKLTAQGLGESRQKWQTWRMAVGWHDTLREGGQWDFQQEKNWKKLMVSKGRVKQFRRTEGDTALWQLVALYRKASKQETGFDDFVKILEKPSA